VFLSQGIQDCLGIAFSFLGFTMFHPSTTFPSKANGVSDEFAADCILFQHLRSAPKRAALLQRHATLLELFWIFHGFPAKAGMMYISKLHEFIFKDIFKKRPHNHPKSPTRPLTHTIHHGPSSVRFSLMR